jgi:sugar-specific transcriptional regulator TrmB
MKEELRMVGLTEGEIAVYLTLLKLGPSTNSPIARHAGLQSSTVYYCLNSLIEKGFVSYIQKGKRRYFIPTAPENILAILDERAKQVDEQRQSVEKILPELKMYHKTLEEKTIAEVYEGFKGFQMIFNQILKTLNRGDSYEAFVIEQALGEPKEIQLLFMRHNKALKAKGIKLRLLAHERMRSIFEAIYGKKFLTIYQEIRYAKEITPVGITIYKNNVVTHISEDGRPMSFLVRNQKLAETYRTYFYSVWERAKP